MAKTQDYTQDYTRMMQDMMGAFPLDAAAMQDALKAQVAFGEKLSRLAMDAASKSAEISSQWTKETITRAAEAASLRKDPADYTRALSDFASAQAELATENLAAFAEVAKQTQMETVELVLAAGKDLSEDAAAAVKKAAKAAAKG